MNRICLTCGNEKKSLEGTFQQVCVTPECVVLMVSMLFKRVEEE